MCVSFVCGLVNSFIISHTSPGSGPFPSFMDSHPPKVLEAYAGVWQLGNRFLAAARETLYWLPKLKELHMWVGMCGEERRVHESAQQAAGRGELPGWKV